MESTTWDPGVTHTIIEQLNSLISDPEQAVCSLDIDEDSQTDIESHANTHVVGKHAYIMVDTGQKSDFNAFTIDHKTLFTAVVGAPTKYDCPYEGTEVDLVIRNTLHVTSRKTKCIPTFMMREDGIQVNDNPNIQVDDNSEEYHFLYFTEYKLHITLSLCGILLYLHY